MAFSNFRDPQPDDRVVYIGGSFDLMHAGHLERLKKAREMGTFVYAGVWSNETANYFKGSNHPILSLHERVLMVLACSYVDDVIIGAPYHIGEELINSLHIKKVCMESTFYNDILEERRDQDPFEVPKKLGIFEELKIENHMSVEVIA